MSDYDAIIIGGGHNGLVTAVTLAKAGHSVLVLEQRDVLGGAAATEEVFPGGKVNTGAVDASLFHDEIVRDLFLKMAGLEFIENPAALFAPQPDGRALTLWTDEQKTVADIARFSPRDAQKYPAFVQQVNGMTAVLRSMMLTPPPDLAALGVNDLAAWGKVGLQTKRMGSKEMMDFMRVLPMPVSEYLDEWFESDAVQGAIGAAGVTGSHLGARGGGSTLMMLYQYSGGFPRARFVRGGMGQLAAALATMARQKGAEIRTGTAVSRIQLNDDGQAVGVLLADGTEIRARVIISNADPRRTFFQLVGPQNLEPRFMRQVRNIIYRGSTARLNLLLNGLPQFNGQTSQEQFTGLIRIAPGLAYVEKAYDAGKYGRVSPNPILTANIPTLLDPTLAPAGQHLMHITMQYAPYTLHESNWQDKRNWLGDHIITTLSHYAPNLQSLISNLQILTPLDLEQQVGLTEGSIMHGQMGLDQLLVMRPVPGWSQYRTPIDNLYLCGAGTHPGGGVTGTPGYNAAREVLRALR
ncbi:MAG: NAD(P)/FAD-dependent oxidoreductase [Ardenticatenaceae bacterium]|nr:NAD(P)/FAD-dependent oxidoreductase [Anaerolineales bacterium]MCB8921214.1 NAD(P)/FAD-dependent oxidoreductase [Ardenticatenaceae bacterium]MCB8992180.1 NAD(P)/FAD-dependent oxidoreductase [Ardenticatenaceae bacterium]MCB9004288.1 NAD(P)/FAD-dependent oxidoreductase [Ardenticatenaceae bacterium]